MSSTSSYARNKIQTYQMWVQDPSLHDHRVFIVQDATSTDFFIHHVHDSPRLLYQVHTYRSVRASTNSSLDQHQYHQQANKSVQGFQDPSHVLLAIFFMSSNAHIIHLNYSFVIDDKPLMTKEHKG